MNSRIFVVITLVLAIGVFAVASWHFSTTKPAAENTTVTSKFAEFLMRSYSPILGEKSAPVTIVEFFDSACEACRAFHPIIKNILAEQAGKVRVVLRYTPLHGEASQVAVRVLEAARMQDVFEPVLEAILEAQPHWASHGRMRPELLPRIAEAAGLNLTDAKYQLLAPQTTGILNQDRNDVETIGVQQTPTFFVNGKQLIEFSESGLRKMVEVEVAAIDR